MQSEYQAAAGTGDPRVSERRDEDPKEQIAHLREQVEELMRERVTPAIADVAARAEEAATQAKDFAQGQVDMAAKVVRERPLTALAIALGVGYVLGRSTR